VLLADAAVLAAFHASTLATVVEALALLTMGGLALLAAGLLVRRPREEWAAGLAGLGLLPAILAGLALVGLSGGTPATALEARAGRTVTVGPGERVDGALAAAGDRVVIEGLVDGDLLVAARTVDIRGRVTGNVVAAGKRVDVQGAVDGHVYAAAAWLGLAGPVAGSLYGAARQVDLAPAGRIGRDLTLAGQVLRLDGVVGRDLTLAAADARVGGEVGRHLLARGERLLVTSGARVGGDARLVARTPGEPRIADGARVDGARRIETGPARRRLARLPGALFWAAVGFFGALLVGGLLLRLRPGVLLAPAERVRGLGRSFGVGLLVLVATPLAVLAAALTLVGLPAALMALAGYLVALYAAYLVVAAALGRAVLGPAAPGFRPALRSLAIGLLLLTVFCIKRVEINQFNQAHFCVITQANIRHLNDASVSTWTLRNLRSNCAEQLLYRVFVLKI
jgi:cytoskeletal protein CcmA (bactofilin family)